MATILIVAGTVLSLYVFEPLWFDTRMHYYHNTYQSDKACNHASTQVEETTGRVCVPKNDHSGHVDLYLTKD
jgi:hypothetical protein